MYKSNINTKYGITDKANPSTYTNDELTVYANGVAALANRVIKQWQLDGSPKIAIDSIEIWEKIADLACSLHGEYADKRQSIEGVK